MTRYLIATDCYNYEPRPGLGWMVQANSIAWRYAKVTGRTLIVDWRDTTYHSNRNVNLFAQLFEPAESIGGVRILTNSLDRLELPGPRLVTDKENFEYVDRALYYDRDLPFPVVEIRAGISPRLYRRFLYEDGFDGFIRGLVMKPHFEHQIADFLEQNFSGRRVVGVHVRHGNGESGHFQNAGRSISDLDHLIQDIKTKLYRYLKDNYTLFLATDSPAVLDGFQRNSLKYVARKQWRPPADSGASLVKGSECPDGEVVNAANAWIDMYLLGCCDVTYFAKGSFMNSLPVQMAKGHENRQITYGFDVGRYYCIGSRTKASPVLQIRRYLNRKLNKILPAI
ncbi:nodulation protein NodZ [Hoeflea poritis]|uniref:Glycosyl transferase family 11 n=1 Tax=Hoeflea poritis TaxID=2993659 RepID=A0ABT4VNT1_9HYPH|nr:nodulation protein NodZ [Hoeflea poritis]MDA4846344.1 hypothetical protein [Hoeflea poritis]